MTDTLLPMFDTPTRHRSHTGDPETSKEAAERVTGSERLKAAILELLEMSGGLTADEAQGAYLHARDARGWPVVQPHSVNRRLSELHSDGRVRDSGRRRETEYGRNAVVWVLS